LTSLEIKFVLISNSDEITREIRSFLLMNYKFR